MNFIRFFSSAAREVTSSNLAQLRKATGLALGQCRKALQLCDNDLGKAKDWLRAEAKRLGLEKALKLQGREASEGLVAVSKSKNVAVMVEMNCETEFVAKNDKFKGLLEVVVNSCFALPQSRQTPNKKVLVNEEELNNLMSPDNEKLSDCVSKLIGQVGEKIVLRRAAYYTANDDVDVDVFVHPPPSDPMKNILTGNYGSFVAFKKNIENSQAVAATEPNLGVNLCKHVIGMNPVKIGGGLEELEPEPEPEESPSTESDDAESGEPKVKVVQSLVHQEYLLDPLITVGELLEEQGAQVMEFQRFHCGEDDVEDGEENRSETESDGRAKEKASQM